MSRRMRGFSLLLVVTGGWVITLWLLLIVLDQHKYSVTYWAPTKHDVGSRCSCNCSEDSEIIKIANISSGSSIHRTHFLKGMNDSLNDTGRTMSDLSLKKHTQKHTQDSSKSKHLGVPLEFEQPIDDERIWPDPQHSGNDRVLSQMNLNNLAKDKVKSIYIKGGPGKILMGRQQFIHDECPVQQCEIVDSSKSVPDVIILKHQPNWNNMRKNSNQIFVWQELESPSNSGPIPDYVNWTATYRRDSTISTPYERFTWFSNFTKGNELPAPARNYAKGKSKKVAWFVSNCNSQNGRMNYVVELQKWIQVDIFGACGTLKCNRKGKHCFEMLSNDYKFYLAFENSNCVDYITEKFFWNGLLNDVLPVVMGARPEDYAAVAPPGSYIHVDDFPSPRHLAEYLHTLDADDDKYNEYFRWKGIGGFINTKFWCRLCSMAHEADITRMHTYHRHTWWDGPGTCLPHVEGEKWASWRNVTRHRALERAVVC